jgi:L-aspartate oxidase
LTTAAVLGSGVAGLTVALRLAGAGYGVVLVTKGELAASATRYAQGGVAAALAGGDSPQLHFSDTISAGGGLCDPEAVRVLCAEGPEALRELMTVGAVFDESPGGTLALAREGGHSTARVVHAGGDATGFEIERALLAAVVRAGVEVREHWLATGLVVTAGRCRGIEGLDDTGAPFRLEADAVVLASGGAGQLFAVTTNPSLSTGDGIAMALSAGAAVADVEFVQFHPTALHHPVMPRPLLSEALRGEGARLRDEAGVAFMAAEHPLADLAPRDVVARAITQRLIDRGLDHLWLDATGIADFPQRFPTIWRASADVGLDPTTDWLPVAPAAHYLCGGVVTDLSGATSLPGLWACGEVACTGVHGANRLASNSLLEGLVFGRRVASAITAGQDGPEPTGAMRDLPLDAPTPESDPGVHVRDPSAEMNASSAAALRDRLQRTMTTYAGVMRDAAGLERAAGEIDQIGAAAGHLPDEPATWELRSLATVAAAVVAAATERRESRGAHHRVDHPNPSQPPERLIHAAGRLVRVTASVLREHVG